MNKKFVCLLLMSFLIVSAENSSISKNDKECCKLLNEAALRAEIMLLCKYDDNFPRRISDHTIHADVPASFTAQKALQCLHNSFLKHNPKVTIIHSDKTMQGSISVTLERVDFDRIMAQERFSLYAQYEELEKIFQFYQLDNQ